MAESPIPPSPPVTGNRSRWSLALLIMIVALAALMVWQWLDSRARVEDLRRDFAKRLAISDAMLRDTQALAKQNQQFADALQTRLSTIENTVNAQQSQQVAIESMYQELSRTRDERVLAEVEQSITIAAQQLQLAGNVEAALIALQGADARLASTAQPQFQPLRRLIARDIETLTAMPVADISGIALHIDNIVAQIDAFPLASERRPQPEAPHQGKANSSAEPTWWRALAGDLWNEIRQLIRIERVDHADIGLLPPAQSYFLRENVKLRLVNVRLALLAHDARSFREDSRQAAQWLDRYFDTRAHPVQVAIDTLKEYAALDIEQQAPSLNETLTAVRNFKLGRKQ